MPASVSPRISKDDVIELPVVNLENLPEMDPVFVGFIITSARIWRLGIRAVRIWSWAVRIWRVSSTTAFLVLELQVVDLENLPEKDPALVEFIITSARICTG